MSEQKQDPVDMTDEVKDKEENRFTYKIGNLLPVVLALIVLVGGSALTVISLKYIFGHLDDRPVYESNIIYKVEEEDFTLFCVEGIVYYRYKGSDLSVLQTKEGYKACELDKAVIPKRASD